MVRMRITGRVWTGTGWASSLTIEGGVIVALDQNDGSAVDQEIELFGGGIVCPGIYGSHEHWMHAYFGEHNQVIDLSGCTTLAQMVEAIRLQRACQPTGTLMFVNWNTGFVPASQLTMGVLDQAVGRRPAVVFDQSFHAAQASSAMMVLLDSQGLPAHAAGSKRGGYLTEEYVMFLIGALTYDPEHLASILEAQQEMLFSMGFTRLFDKGVMGGELFWRLHDLFGSGRLVMPTEALVPVWMLEDQAIASATATTNFRLRGAKDFADGAFGARTAACGPLHYHGTDNGGLVMRTDEQLMQGIVAVREAGLDFFGVHCIGPAAIAQYARVMDAALMRFGPSEIGITLSFEHLECPDLEVIRQIAALQRAGVNVEVNTNPTFASDLVDYPGHVHPDVLSRVNPYGDFRREGLEAHGGTDGIPDHDVWGSIGTMVTRPDGRREQELTVEEAFGLYSDTELKVGAPATFLFVDRDFVTCPYEVSQVQVRETWIGGKRVWRQTA